MKKNIREELQDQRDEIDRKLAILNRVGEDTFPIGTIALFSSAQEHGYYRKIAEESWRFMESNTGGTRQLREIILEWEDSPVGYFEIYKLLPEATPFYVSA